MKKVLLNSLIFLAVVAMFIVLSTIILNIFDTKILTSIIDTSFYVILIAIAIFIMMFILFLIFVILKKKDKKYEQKFKESKVLLFSSIILLMLSVIFFFDTVYVLNYKHEQMPLAKPVIYIYPEKDMNVNVKLVNDKNISCSYPKYKDSWNVFAKINGDLIDSSTNRSYYSLYWEGKNYKSSLNNIDGFCVKGEDTISFLEEKLDILGLSEREANEFIIYWLPKMESNKYNYIRFKTSEEIEEYMKLEITPLPKTVIRVSMDFMALDKYIELKPQDLTRVERTGYTVVEWGGNEIK